MNFSTLRDSILDFQPSFGPIEQLPSLRTFGYWIVDSPSSRSGGIPIQRVVHWFRDIRDALVFGKSKSVAEWWDVQRTFTVACRILSTTALLVGGVAAMGCLVERIGFYLSSKEDLVPFSFDSLRSNPKVCVREDSSSCDSIYERLDRPLWERFGDYAKDVGCGSRFSCSWLSPELKRYVETPRACEQGWGSGLVVAVTKFLGDGTIVYFKCCETVFRPYLYLVVTVWNGVLFTYDAVKR